jgi:superfamily II DNA/RNA helicase
MLIFTQFNAMLDILERFLALIGFSYLRIDGGTKPEHRQLFADSFNASERITCMILSTRSGGVGLNLTGADTVIFYDIDWNPTMDLQAQDRCHRIGQTRLVTIFRLVSEHTVEERILKKSRERKLLNNIVIRAGNFGAIGDVGQTVATAPAAEPGAGAGDAVHALAKGVSIRSFFHDFDEDAEPIVNEGITEADLASTEDQEDKAALARALQEQLADEEADTVPDNANSICNDASSACDARRLIAGDSSSSSSSYRRCGGVAADLTEVERILVRAYRTIHPNGARRHYDALRAVYAGSIDETTQIPAWNE